MAIFYFSGKRSQVSAQGRLALGLQYGPHRFFLGKKIPGAFAHDLRHFGARHALFHEVIQAFFELCGQGD